MKKLFFIDDTQENKISFYLLAAFLVALPFDHFYSEWLLIIFCLHILVYVRKANLKKLSNKNVWIVASIFFLSAAAIIFSGYKTTGIKDISQQLAIILFPVFLSISNLNINRYKWLLLELFALTCVATTLYLYFEAAKTIRYFHLPVSSIFSRAFINQNFTTPIGLHATYFSMYVLLSICIFLFLFYRTTCPKKIKYIFYTMILFAGLVQLSSRAPFIAAGIIFICIIPFFLLRGKRRIFFFVTALFSFVLIFLVVTQVDSLKKRYITDLENDLSDYQDPGDLTESRLMRWNLEWQLIEASPIFGYGTGSEIYILKQKYFENKFYRSYLLGLNAHNQYLSFLLSAGVAGLLLYLYIFYYAINLAIKRKDFLLLCFMIILLVVSFSENILDVTKGVLFYSFFFSLFLFSIPLKRLQVAPQK